MKISVTIYSTEVVSTLRLRSTSKALSMGLTDNAVYSTMKLNLGEFALFGTTAGFIRLAAAGLDCDS